MNVWIGVGVVCVGVGVRDGCGVGVCGVSEWVCVVRGRFGIGGGVGDLRGGGVLFDCEVGSCVVGV